MMKVGVTFINLNLKKNQYHTIFTIYGVNCKYCDIDSFLDSKFKYKTLFSIFKVLPRLHTHLNDFRCVVCHAPDLLHCGFFTRHREI